MDSQLQGILTRIQSDLATNAQSFIPTPRKLDAESIISATVVFVGFYLASLLVKKVAEKFFLARKIDEALARFLIRATRISLVALGLVTALGTLGVDVSAIVAGLGLTGLALGIALKDVVSNAVSGVMLLLFRPFRHKDLIKVGEFEGMVCDIDLRYTHLRTTNKVIFVPNSLMFAQAVSVISSPVETVETAIGKGKASKQALAAVVEELPGLVPEAAAEPEAPPRSRSNLLMALADEKVAA